MMFHLFYQRAAAALVCAAVVVSVVTMGTAAPPTSGPAGVSNPDPPTVEEAQEHQRAGRWEEAAAAWRQIAEADPENGTAWFNLGYTLHAARHLDEAIEAHRKAATFDDYHGIALYNLGCAYALTGRSDEAFEALTASQAAGFRVRGQVESDSDLDSLRGDPRFAALLAREPAGFEEQLQQILARAQQIFQQQAPQIQQRIAMIAQQVAAQARSALAQFQKELSEDERFAEIAQGVQELLGGGRPTGQGRGPTSHLQDESAVDAAALLEKASRLQGEGNWLDAAAVYEIAAQASPDDPRPWFGLGYCLHMSGAYEKAIEAHKKAATFEATRGIALYNLACACSLAGRLDEAMEALHASQEAGFDLAAVIATDSDLENLHDDPRFAKLLAELNIDL